MKDVVKLIGIIGIGLFIAIIVYPVLHELGHVLVAIIIGSEVLEFNLFPLPNVLCNVSGVSTVENIMIGAGGIILPFVFSTVIYSKKFWIWYIGMVINIICLISFVISTIGCVLFLVAEPIENEDITQILNLCPNTANLWLVGFLVLIGYTGFRIYKSHPIKHCIEYFD